MQITQVTVARTRSDGNYGNDRVEFRADVTPEDAIETVLESLSMLAAAAVQASNQYDPEDLDGRKGYPFTGLGRLRAPADPSPQEVPASQVLRLALGTLHTEMVDWLDHAEDWYSDAIFTQLRMMLDRLASVIMGWVPEDDGTDNTPADPWDPSTLRGELARMTASRDNADFTANELREDLKEVRRQQEHDVLRREAEREELRHALASLREREQQLRDLIIHGGTDNTITEDTRKTAQIEALLEALIATATDEQGRPVPGKGLLAIELKRVQKALAESNAIRILQEEDAHRQQNELDERLRSQNALRGDVQHLRAELATRPFPLSGTVVGHTGIIEALTEQNAQLAKQVVALSGHSSNRLDFTAKESLLEASVTTLRQHRDELALRLDMTERERDAACEASKLAQGSVAMLTEQALSLTTRLAAYQNEYEASVARDREVIAGLQGKFNALQTPPPEPSYPLEDGPDEGEEADLSVDYWRDLAHDLEARVDALQEERDSQGRSIASHTDALLALQGDRDIWHSRCDVLQADLTAALSRWEMSGRSDVQAQARNLLEQVGRLKINREELIAANSELLHERDKALAASSLLLHERDEARRQTDQQHALAEKLAEEADERQHEIDSAHGAVRDG